MGEFGPLAGGGIKGGLTCGATDEFGYHIAKDKVHVHALQATILHCFGFNHTKLTGSFQNGDFRLTDVLGELTRIFHGLGKKLAKSPR